MSGDLIRGRRPKKLKDIPALDRVGEETRVELTQWMKGLLSDIERVHAERVEILRNGGEHPIPIFQQMMKQFGVLGMPKRLAAKLLGMKVPTLDSYYADDYDIGQAEMLKKVASNMVRIAVSTTDPAAWKVGMDILNRMGGEEWKPPAQKLKVEHDDAAPIINSDNLSPEQRQTLRALMIQALEQQGTEPVPEDDAPLIIEPGNERDA